MAEQLTTGFIVFGGLVGIALGLYGLAPVFFQQRLKRLRTAIESGWPGSAEDFEDPEWERLDAAYGILVDSRRRESSLFGLPTAWNQAQTPEPAPQAMPVADIVRELARASQAEDGEVELEAVPVLAAALDDAEDEVAAETLEIFREVLPPAPSVAVRTRDVLGAGAVQPVPIVDLLTDARWTAFALLNHREVPQT
jgi:hypothetical protein